MLYTGFTEAEVKKITGILDFHSVRDEINHNDNPPKPGTDFFKKHHENYGYAKLANAHFEISIEADEFLKISAEGLDKLAALNIYPEVSELDFQVPESVTVPEEKKKKDKFMMLMGIIGLAFMLYMALAWLDRYVSGIFPQKKYYFKSGSERIFHKQLINW